MLRQRGNMASANRYISCPVSTDNFMDTYASVESLFPQQPKAFSCLFQSQVTHQMTAANDSGGIHTNCDTHSTRHLPIAFFIGPAKNKLFKLI